MRKRYAPFAALAVVAALAGCGNGQEAAVEATLRKALLSHDPAKCTEVVTENALQEIEAKSGAEALEECEERTSERKHDTRAVNISAVKVEDDAATAEVAFVGGSFTGQTIRVALVDESGRWKLDQFVRITEFHRKLFLAGAGLKLADVEGTSPDQRRCVVAKLGEKSKGEIEAVVFQRSDAAEIELSRACPNGDYDLPANAEIAKAIDGLVRATDPAACLEFATQRYLESISRRQGTAAIAACVQQVEEAPIPDEDVVSNIRVSGSAATAKVVLRGNAIGGDVGLLYGLVREHGHWKADSTVRLLSIDRLAFAKGILQGLTESGIEVNATVSACVLAKMQRISLRRLEALLLPLDTALSAKIFGPCAQAGSKVPPPA